MIFSDFIGFYWFAIHSIGSVVIMNNNQLTEPIPSTIQTLTQLRTLILYSNRITGTIPSQLGSVSTLGYAALVSIKCYPR